MVNLYHKQLIYQSLNFFNPHTNNNKMIIMTKYIGIKILPIGFNRLLSVEKRDGFLDA